MYTYYWISIHYNHNNRKHVIFISNILRPSFLHCAFSRIRWFMFIELTFDANHIFFYLRVSVSDLLVLEWEWLRDRRKYLASLYFYNLTVVLRAVIRCGALEEMIIYKFFIWKFSRTYFGTYQLQMGTSMGQIIKYYSFFDLNARNKINIIFFCRFSLDTTIKEINHQLMIRLIVPR